MEESTLHLFAATFRGLCVLLLPLNRPNISCCVRERERQRSHSHTSLSSRTVIKPSEAAVSLLTMKRPNSSDSLISIFPSAGPLGAEFPPIMDGMEDDDCGEEDLCSSGHAAGVPSSEKKRRLSTDQVRALEKNFEVDNKLDPERKVRLAQELSLQPRQVAVWFQNRRARWKTKQLERDYSALRSSYDALRQDYDSLRHDNQALDAEIKELKAKLGEEESSYSSVKEEEEQVASESDLKPSEVEEETLPPPTAVEAALIYKDGSSDSDTSAVLNDDTSPYHPMFACSPAILATYSPSFTISAPNGSQFWSSDAARARGAAAGLSIGFSFHHQTKTEEHGFELPCSSFFSDEQPWHYSDQWSWMDGGGEHSNIGRREGLS